jgi:hypothetical protein
MPCRHVHPVELVRRVTRRKADPECPEHISPLAISLANCTCCGSSIIQPRVELEQLSGLRRADFVGLSGTSAFPPKRLLAKSFALGVAFRVAS